MGKYREVEIKHIDEVLKRRIVAGIESGRLGQCEAAREYGLSRTAISKWLRVYGKIKVRTKLVEVVMKEDREEISRLKDALADAHLKLRLYEKMFEVAKRDYNIDLKKNYQTKALESLRQKDAK